MTSRRARLLAAGPGARAALALLLLLLLLAPSASAHLQGARPIVQATERPRVVDLRPEGLLVRTSLGLSAEPLRHLITHETEPARGRFLLEYRPDGIRAEDAMTALWEAGRIVEYRDVDLNARYDASVDAAAKVWRFTHYQWTLVAVQRAQVGGVLAFDVVWEGNLTGAPQIRVELVVAGHEFVDEGVRVRPQDVAIYLDIVDVPPRGVGNLHAFEWEVRVPDRMTLSLHEVENTTTALLADAYLRRAIFLWGGEALLDGAETRLAGTLSDERAEGGERRARLTLHIPATDESMRFILVSGVEYGVELKRQPLDAWLVLVAGAAVALALRRRA